MKPRTPPRPDILRLGRASFLTDLSSEMIFSVFAVFFTTIAGASSALLGLIEGLADCCASSLNDLAGWLSAQRRSCCSVRCSMPLVLWAHECLPCWAIAWRLGVEPEPIRVERVGRLAREGLQQEDG